MSFNFPASPSNGQTYTPVGGPVFTWDGTAWKALSQGMPVTVFVGDVAPTAPAFGNLWWESDTGNLYIYYNDGDSAQWVQINGTPAGYQTADTRNRIVNGGMQISQENGTSGGTTNNYYPVDQWYLGFAATTAVVGVRQRVLPNTATRMPYRFQADVTTADASMTGGKFITIGTKIEGGKVADFGWPSGGTPVVLRFAFASPVAGTFSVGLRSGGVDASWLGSFTVTAGEVGNLMERSFAIPAPAIGTWPVDTSAGMYVHVCLAAGPSISGVAGWQSGNWVAVPGQVNGVAATITGFFLTNVGLYLDPDNTGVAPKWQMPDEAEEFRACQRYWQTALAHFSGTVTSGLGYYSMTTYPHMRVAPAGTGVNNNAASFPTTVGTINAASFQAGDSFSEGRSANATGSGRFITFWSLNSRM